LDIANPFIRLPCSFDAAKLAAEFSELDESAWMMHPKRMMDQSAMALHALQGWIKEAVGVTNAVMIVEWYLWLANY